jgi:hypothetical protein
MQSDQFVHVVFGIHVVKSNRQDGPIALYSVRISICLVMLAEGDTATLL